ncbi:hypothetical protein D3C73_589230 [compost metagenome]
MLLFQLILNRSQKADLVFLHDYLVLHDKTIPDVVARRIQQVSNIYHYGRLFRHYVILLLQVQRLFHLSQSA